MPVRGIRGATTVSADQPDLVLDATRDLLLAICQANPSLHPEDLASAWFTTTPDLVSTYPARAARESLGWAMVPLMCTQEIPVPNGLPRCVRVLLHWNTDLAQSEIKHIYLNEAVRLRPDLVQANNQ